MDLVSTMWEYIFKAITEKLKSDYDYIIVNSAPYLGLMTLIVLAGCYSVLIPVTPEYILVKALELLLQTVMKIKGPINPI